MEKKLQSPVGKEAKAAKAAKAVPVVVEGATPAEVPAKKKPVGRRIEGRRTAEEIILALCKSENGASVAEVTAQITKEFSDGNENSHKLTAQTYLTDSQNYVYFGGRLAQKYGLKAIKTGEGKEARFHFRPVTKEELAECERVREAKKAEKAAKKADLKATGEEVKKEIEAKNAPAE